MNEKRGQLPNQQWYTSSGERCIETTLEADQEHEVVELLSPKCPPCAEEGVCVGIYTPCEILAAVLTSSPEAGRR